ncbi:hypothetical protein BCT75_05135 [Vibrio lentus]|uniref:AAA family ATPase n=1 Tax=Vibrio lentus TaxID=136468 RepID=UPI000C841271|nr:AAA family ATPase [Vibrio lentus]PML44431.1 hypothetical protein BCT75_05135 [Vibrio lentus]
MKIFYQGYGARGIKPRALAAEPNALVLTKNSWDDYGVKTSFDADLYFDGEKLDFSFHVKVLIEGSIDTSSTLDFLLAEGWDGRFPIPDKSYVSLPSDIELYSILVSKLGKDKAGELLDKLADAGYLENILQDGSVSVLISSSEFSGSLLRESGAINAFRDGWKLFYDEDIRIEDFELNVQTRDNTSVPIPFKFSSRTLPADINVLIGPNGIGKSFCIKSLVEYWLRTGMGAPDELEQSKHIPFDRAPNFTKMVLVSYSLFEEFPLDLEDADDLNDKQAYKYFGFRKRLEGSECIEKDLPKHQAAESIIKIIYDDYKFDFVEGRVKKLKAVEEAMQRAFSYDDLLLEVPNIRKLGVLPRVLQERALLEIDGKHYLSLFPELPNYLDKDKVIEACNLKAGVEFSYRQQLCQLSSGQYLYTCTAINVVGELRENCLVVIDEPELFLHPTLEIEFISLLKAILEPFKSKAILATHSLSVVREVPSRCVHIFRHGEFGLDIVPPPFETFGGDMQRISTYVFGENSVSKPFEERLEELVVEHGSRELIRELRREVNEEMIMKIMDLGQKYGC